jgi:hypothetical protein
VTGVPLARFAARLAIVLLALLAVGCADDQPRDEPVREFGRLVVKKSLAEGAIFIEGSVTELRVDGGGGEAILDGLRPIDTLDRPLLDRAVPEGRYNVGAVERPCQGNCDFLDPPAEETRCEVEAEVRADRTTHVAIVLTVASGGPDSDCSATTGG